MFEKFGEFDSAEEINRKAEELKADKVLLYKLAEENGIQKEDVEDYLDGCVDELVTVSTAAAGKLRMESKDLEISGILEDWTNIIIEMCMESKDFCAAVRKKSKRLCEFMAGLIAFAFENKVQVSNKIVKSCRVKHNGKKESLKGPLYLGVPNRKEVIRMAEQYYLEAEK